MKVKIYCLYDPLYCKIRYIGRTTKAVLEHRLIEHISKSKYYIKYYPNQKANHRVNWINNILNEGRLPKIKLLTIVEGWQESYEFEKQLIKQYFEKCDLVNSQDRGSGPESRIIDQDLRDRISNTLKEYYSVDRENKLGTYKKVYVYHLNGEFYKEFKSNIFAAKELNVSMCHIRKLKSGEVKYPKQYQFSSKYVEKMDDYTNLGSLNCKSIMLVNKTTNEKVIFNKLKDFKIKFNVKSELSIEILINKHLNYLFDTYNIYIKDKLVLPSR